LQQRLGKGGSTVATYNWLADGTKYGVVDNNNNGYDYTGSLIYSRSGSVRTPESIENGAGRIIYSGGTYNPHYYITDHLGSTRVITDNSGSVVERDDFYPFGGQLAISTYPQFSVNRFKFNGKELQTTGNTGFLDYGARMYDDEIGRWGVIDPHAENYYPWSPYHYVANNPIRVTDPTGMDWYEFDQSGKYQKKTEMEGTNRIMIHTVEKTKEGYEYDSYKLVDFADPENDAKDIDDGTINTLVFVSENEMQSMMKQQGAFESGKLNFGLESQGGGDFDYSFTVLSEKYSDAKFDASTMKSNSLFLPEGDNTAHNFMNFGNYLWGATGYSVGFDYAALQSGAHINSLLNSKRNGYPAQWDSKDDQLSMIKGIYHAQTHNYRKLRK